MEISLTAQFEIPLIFHAANFRNLVLTRKCFSPRRFSYRFGMAGKSNGSCMNILSRRLYQGSVCHVSVTSVIASTFPRITLFIIRAIKLKGGNAKLSILFQSWFISSVAKLFGSGFHVMYWGSWWYSLKANRSTVGVPKSLVIFRKTF